MKKISTILMTVALVFGIVNLVRAKLSGTYALLYTEAGYYVSNEFDEEMFSLAPLDEFDFEESANVELNETEIPAHETTPVKVAKQKKEIAEMEPIETVKKTEPAEEIVVTDSFISEEQPIVADEPMIEETTVSSREMEDDHEFEFRPELFSRGVPNFKKAKNSNEQQTAELAKLASERNLEELAKR